MAQALGAAGLGLCGRSRGRWCNVASLSSCFLHMFMALRIVWFMRVLLCLSVSCFFVFVISLYLSLHLCGLLEDAALRLGVSVGSNM